jgi:hypothetical protein
MDRPAQTPATAREIIQEILRNMREGLEPLQYSTLAPSIYHVYLHPGDMERLRGIQPRIIDEARRALDAEVEALNRASLGERLKIAKRSDPKIETPDGGWQIRFLENTDDEVEPGDIEVSSELGLPAKTEFGSGSMTKRIATRRNAAAVSASYGEATRAVSAPAPLPPLPPAPAAAAVAAPAGSAAFAVIDYEDQSGRRSFPVTKDQIVVGRGGRDYWTDLKLDTLPDVSREHFRLRRDPDSGRFFLKDLSRLGTTINGEPAPSSIEVVNGEKRDRNVEAPVPDKARIGLAGVVFLDFRSTSNG